jgi:hypothetical protein
MYFVVEWETDKITHRCKHLKQAKGWARGAGHTGEDHPLQTGYPPRAHVQNEAGECVYNPRFGKRFSSEMSGLINAQPPDRF